MVLEVLHTKKTPTCAIHDKAGHTQMTEESGRRHRWLTKNRERTDATEQGQSATGKQKRRREHKTQSKIGSPKRPRILGMWRVNHNHGTKNNQEPNVRVQLMWGAA